MTLNPQPNKLVNHDTTNFRELIKKSEYYFERVEGYGGPGNEPVPLLNSWVYTERAEIPTGLIGILTRDIRQVLFRLLSIINSF